MGNCQEVEVLRRVAVKEGKNAPTVELCTEQTRDGHIGPGRVYFVRVSNCGDIGPADAAVLFGMATAMLADAEVFEERMKPPDLRRMFGGG